MVFGSGACKCASIKGVWCVWMWGLDAAQASQGLHGLWVLTRVGPVKGVDCMCGCWDEERPAEGLTQAAQAALLWNLMQCPRLKCSESRLCVVLLRLGRTVHWRDGTRLKCEAVNTTPGAEFCAWVHGCCHHISLVLSDGRLWAVRSNYGVCVHHRANWCLVHAHVLRTAALTLLHLIAVSQPHLNRCAGGEFALGSTGVHCARLPAVQCLCMQPVLHW